MEAAYLQPSVSMGWVSIALVLPCKDTICFCGSKVLGNTLGKGCSAFEFWSRACHKNVSMGLWKGQLESSQNKVRLSKYFGSPELITFPCLHLWGVSL